MMLPHEEIISLIKKWTPLDKSRKADDGQPAEIFDRHPISAMTCIDPEIQSNPFLLVTDNWRTEWHKDGVQVAVKPIKDLLKPKVREWPLVKSKRNFQLPRKLIRVSTDRGYNPDKHCLVPLTNFSYSGVLYHVDELDLAWIATVNEERECLGDPLVQEWMLEHVVHASERLCHKQMQKLMREVEGLGLEFDENSKCDVCQCLEAEDDNEMVFCDECFVCVHQACYGILNIPSGSWICRMCQHAMKSTTQCLLCPNTGGAMKPTDCVPPDWCHVSCALWIPEVSFCDVDRMEPIQNIKNIPQARWNLVCSLCKLRQGACVQCSVKSCKVAFHVTCGFRENLVMRQQLCNNDVKLMGYCRKHSKHPANLENTKEIELSRAARHEQAQNAEELKRQKLAEIMENFHTYVTFEEVSLIVKKQNIPRDIQDKCFVYWKLKRRINRGRPLIQVKEDQGLAEQDRLQNRANKTILDNFFKVRFGLDRARLLVDMVLKREKQKLSLISKMGQIAELQGRTLLTNKALKQINDTDLNFLGQVHMGDSLYDNWNLLKQFKKSTLSFDNNCQQTATTKSSNNNNTKLSAEKPGKARKRKLDNNNCTPSSSSTPSSKKPKLSIGAKSADKNSPSAMKLPKQSQKKSTGKRVRLKLEEPGESGDCSQETEPQTDLSLDKIGIDYKRFDIHPVDLIPREQLIVPESIKARLRSRLSRPEYAHIIHSIGNPLITNDNDPHSDNSSISPQNVDLAVATAQPSSSCEVIIVKEDCLPPPETFLSDNSTTSPSKLTEREPILSLLSSKQQSSYEVKVGTSQCNNFVSSHSDNGKSDDTDCVVVVDDVDEKEEEEKKSSYDNSSSTKKQQRHFGNVFDSVSEMVFR